MGTKRNRVYAHTLFLFAVLLRQSLTMAKNITEKASVLSTKFVGIIKRKLLTKIRKMYNIIIRRSDIFFHNALEDKKK